MQVNTALPVAELLKAVSQLSSADLEQLLSQVVALQAQRRAPSLSAEETDLLLKINQGLPADVQQRYDDLVAKRQAETLTAEEHRELLRLTEQIEASDVQRVKYLAKLARLRGVSLTTLMDDLGLTPPAYAVSAPSRASRCATNNARIA